MRIAIHHRPNSCSEHWIEYCQKHNIQYKIVNAYSNDIIEQVADCDIFMWYHSLNQYKDYLFAKQLLYIIGVKMGKITYPDFNTCWHYDDKIGQKYLLESIGAPTIPTHIFYQRKNALEWIKKTTYPKVFKLRSGASSKNVHFVKNARQAKKLVNKAFSFGFQRNSHFIRIRKRWIQIFRGNCTLKWFLKGIITPYSYNDRFEKKEIGYVYFQDYLPNNDFDIRVFVVGNKAFAIKRMNRENDFRASGSGILIYDKREIDETCIKIAFDTSRKLRMQSVAFDFLRDTNGRWAITEISYRRDNKHNGILGYWTDDLQWHNCNNINVYDWLIENVIDKANSK